MLIDWQKYCSWPLHSIAIHWYLSQASWYEKPGRKIQQTQGEHAKGTYKNRKTLHIWELNPSYGEAIVPITTLPCRPYILLPWHKMKSCQDAVSTVCSPISTFIVCVFVQGLGLGGHDVSLCHSDGIYRSLNGDWSCKLSSFQRVVLKNGSSFLLVCLSAFLFMPRQWLEINSIVYIVLCIYVPVFDSAVHYNITGFKIKYKTVLFL